MCPSLNSYSRTLCAPLYKGGKCGETGGEKKWANKYNTWAENSLGSGGFGENAIQNVTVMNITLSGETEKRKAETLGAVLLELATTHGAVTIEEDGNKTNGRDKNTRGWLKEKAYDGVAERERGGGRGWWRSV